MNNARNFGVEIECFSSKTKQSMAIRITSFLRMDGFANDYVQVGGYSHMTDRYNTTNWKIEEDGSLIPTGNIRENFPYRMEIKTPVLKGNDGLKRLCAVCKAIKDVTTVNKRCGLHVHHDISNLKNGESIRNLINNWIAHEKYFMMALPNSRQTNIYCKKWSDFINVATPINLPLDGDPIRWFDIHIGTRRATLNLQSYRIRGTVEVRMHSGTVEYEKISNWITLTQLYIEKALKNRFPIVNNLDEFINNMKENYSSNSTGHQTKSVYIHPKAKMKKLPKRGTKKYRIIQMLLGTSPNGDGATKKQIVQTLDVEFGELHGGKQEKYVSGQLTNMKNPKYGYGLNIVKEGLRFKLLPVNPTSPTDTTNMMAVEITDDDKAAIDWYKKRCQLFELERNHNTKSFTYIEPVSNTSFQDITRTLDQHLTNNTSYQDRARIWLTEITN